MRVRLLLLLFLLVAPFIFMSCGKNTQGIKLPPGAIAVVNSTVFTRSRILYDNKTILYFPEGISKAERDALTEACEVQLRAFEEDWGAPSLPTEVYFFDEFSIPCANLDGTFSGCYYVNGPIHLITGYGRSNNIAPSFYHELVHLNVPGHDLRHQDPRWELLWYPRQNELREQLRDR